VDTSFAFDKRGTVTLSVGSGEIIVRTWDQASIRVRARSERSSIRMDASSTRLSLDLTRQRGGDTRYELTVPAGARISARATSGDITITGAKGGVEAHTQNGDIVIEDVADMVDIGTLNGDIQVRGVNGSVDISTVGGDVSLSDIKGDVESTSVSGDIDLRGVSAKYVRAKSTSGDISFDGVVDTSGRYELGSHSGGVYLTIPQNTGALLTVSTYSGTIDSDFPITLKPGEHGIGTTKRFTFEIGKGDARISAESFSGDITIRIKGRKSTD
jgi:DUF4097 and DUF4098 domain-containing protein YvlB